MVAKLIQVGGGVSKQSPSTANIYTMNEERAAEGLIADDLGSMDNVTDPALGEFRDHYGDLSITKDDIWFYIYGVMHAPDWRKKYKLDLRESLPRLPYAPDFRAFRDAGEELMALHTGYETCPEHPDVVCEIDGEPDDGDAEEKDVYRIVDRMRWGKLPGKREVDKSRLIINERSRCHLVGIPLQAHQYEISGSSPLEWEVKTLRYKTYKASGITNNPNTCEEWADDPFELIRHLRRLVHVSVRSAEIIAALPPSLPPSSPTEAAS